MGRLNRLLIAIAAATVVASCGAGSTQTAGIDRGGIVAGPVTGYGSVFVNGERYLTGSAAITVNGQSATEADIKIGHVVVLNSKSSNGDLIAETIVYESSLQGPVESIDIAGGSLVALGQQVIVNSGTSFGSGISPADLSALQLDDIVEISGLSDNDGQIRATRIEREDAPFEIQLSGMVSMVDAMQLTIGTQAVDFSAAMLNDFPTGSIAIGDQVRVAGETFGLSGEILATVVEYRGELAVVNDGDDGEIEGFIASFIGPANFKLAGFEVTTNSQTSYSRGTAGDLANNVRIEAEGSFDSAGTLVADQIEFRKEGNAELEATVDSVIAGSNTVTVFGITVETTLVTSIEDKRDELRPFGLADLVAGDYLKISGSWNGSSLVATQLERVGPEDKFKLQGFVESAATPDFMVLGKTVMTDAAATEFEVNELEEQTQAQFFNALSTCLPTTQGCEIEAAWAADGSLLVADEVAVE